MAVARHTISLDEEVSKSGVARSKALRYDSFSEYVEYLIRKDTDDRPKHIVVREEPPDGPPGGKRRGG